MFTKIFPTFMLFFTKKKKQFEKSYSVKFEIERKKISKIE